jgi:hypothetical protein
VCAHEFSYEIGDILADESVFPVAFDGLRGGGYPNMPSTFLSSSERLLASRSQ